MKKISTLCLLLTVGFVAQSQNTNISGTINAYASVSNISASTLTISSSAAFSVGDLVLVIQMQGASIDETDNPTFGDVVNMNQAGNYELVQVCGIPSGTELSISQLQRSYDPSGNIQVVRVPEYQQATVTSDLTGDAWNGTTGGVVALKCEKLSLNANIDMNGSGFNGGALTTSGFACQWFLNLDDYFYDISGGEGAMKGEGLAAYIANKTGGRGAQATGGGGGNDHNAGGGGGANAGAGGQGGERIPEGTFFCSGAYPGEGGKAYAYNNLDNKIFLGGAGGAGHENNAGLGSAGANGGGIVFIIADTIEGNSNSILVQGLASADGNDGVGGGGAGGTVLINASVYSGTLNIDASGADGGSVDNIGPSNCNGPGGGGGGGLLWVNSPSIPAEINFIGTGGSNGNTLTASQTNCSVGNPNNAAPGASGLSLTDLVVPMPVEASSVDTQVVCDSLVWIDGNTYYSSNNSATHVIVGGAASGCDSTVMLDLSVQQIDTSVTQLEAWLISNETSGTIQWFMGVGTVNSDCGDTHTLLAGETDDSLNTWQYTGGMFFAVITVNGCTDTTACYMQGWESIAENTLGVRSVYPNPTSGSFRIEFSRFQDKVKMTVLDLAGKTVQESEYLQVQQIDGELEVAKGVYVLKLESAGERALIRIVKE